LIGGIEARTLDIGRFSPGNTLSLLRSESLLRCQTAFLQVERRIMRTRNVCIALALMAAPACGGGGGGSTNPPPPSGNTPPPVGGISVQNNLFSPSSRTIAAGNSVTWSWNSCTSSSSDPYGGGGAEVCVEHGVNFDDGINSPTQDRGSYVRTFTAAGVYNYHCAVHGTAMAGSITVQ
jgi:plastocyanin